MTDPVQRFKKYLPGLDQAVANENWERALKSLQVMIHGNEPSPELLLDLKPNMTLFKQHLLAAACPKPWLDQILDLPDRIRSAYSKGCRLAFQGGELIHRHIIKQIRRNLERYDINLHHNACELRAARCVGTSRALEEAWRCGINATIYNTSIANAPNSGLRTAQIADFLERLDLCELEIMALRLATRSQRVQNRKRNPHLSESQYAKRWRSSCSNADILKEALKLVDTRRDQPGNQSWFKTLFASLHKEEDRLRKQSIKANPSKPGSVDELVESLDMWDMTFLDNVSPMLKRNISKIVRVLDLEAAASLEAGLTVPLLIIVRVEFTPIQEIDRQLLPPIHFASINRWKIRRETFQGNALCYAALMAKFSIIQVAEMMLGWLFPLQTLGSDFSEGLLVFIARNLCPSFDYERIKLDSKHRCHTVEVFDSYITSASHFPLPNQVYVCIAWTLFPKTGADAVLEESLQPSNLLSPSASGERLSAFLITFASMTAAIKSQNPNCNSGSELSQAIAAYLLNPRPFPFLFVLETLRDSASLSSESASAFERLLQQFRGYTCTLMSWAR